MIKIEKQLREFLVRAGHYTDKQGIAYRTAKGLNQIEQKTSTASVATIAPASCADRRSIWVGV